MDASGRLDRRVLRLLGFPVTVNNGFWLFLLIVFAIDPGPDGLVLAVALAAFTIIHELGHALVARRLGAEASIALGFMVGYTAYAPRRPLGTAARMALSAAGPVAHIAVGWLCLLPWAQHPLDLDPIAASGAATAIWWAGAVIGAANLIPVWPLDGGHLLSAALQPVFGPSTPRVVIGLSATVTTAGVLWAASRPEWRSLVVVGALLLWSQISALRVSR